MTHRPHLLLPRLAAAALGIAAATAIAAPATGRLDSCSWDRPGQDPFMGDVVAAVDRYADIAAPTRAKLKARMARRAYDDLVVISRDAIAGAHAYEPAIRDMHFGDGRVCGSVTRSAWSVVARERGLVYCEDGHCIVVPTVCRNVSRIERRPQQARQDPPAAVTTAAPPPAAADPVPFVDTLGAGSTPSSASLLPAPPADSFAALAQPAPAVWSPLPGWPVARSGIEALRGPAPAPRSDTGSAVNPPPVRPLPVADAPVLTIPPGPSPGQCRPSRSWLW